MKKHDTSKQSDPWARFDAMTDADIDYSDIPPADDEFFRNAKLVFPKKAVSIRLDLDIINHFKEGGRGWQTRMNAILRESMAKTH